MDLYVSYDPAARATYIQVAEVPVARTESLTDTVMVDLDEFGQPVGVEFLTLPNLIQPETLHALVEAYPPLKALVETDKWLLPALTLHRV